MQRKTRATDGRVTANGGSKNLNRQNVPRLELFAANRAKFVRDGAKPGS